MGESPFLNKSGLDAFSIVSLTSFTPAFTALRTYICFSVTSAIIRASEVLPTPGGPQKIQE